VHRVVTENGLTPTQDLMRRLRWDPVKKRLCVFYRPTKKPDEKFIEIPLDKREA